MREKRTWGEREKRTYKCLRKGERRKNLWKASKGNNKKEGKKERNNEEKQNEEIKRGRTK